MAAININTEQFRQIMEGEQYILVDFWAPWCSYCRRIAPAYDKISQQYSDSLIVGKVNVDEEQQLAEKEQIEVLPTLILYKNGQALGSIVAPESKAMIDTFIQETLNRQ